MKTLLQIILGTELTSTARDITMQDRIDTSTSINYREMKWIMASSRNNRIAT